MGDTSFTDIDLTIEDEDLEYDPLADIGPVGDDEEEEDEGDFTGTPIESLVERVENVPAFEPQAEDVPASERIEQLFSKLNARRRVLTGIMRFVKTPQSAADLDKKVEELQKKDFSVYSGANYGKQLEGAGAIEKTDENGVPFRDAPEQAPNIVEVDGIDFYEPAPWRTVYWKLTEAGQAYLDKDDPAARLARLFETDTQYTDIFLRILDACAVKGGAVTKDLNAMVDNDPLVQNPRLYTAHFTELLERCEAIRWEGTWVITDVGNDFLNGVHADTQTEE